MPTCNPNVTITATSFSSPQTLFNATGATVGGVAGTDIPRRAIVVRNRDGTNAIRVAVKMTGPAATAGAWLNDGADGGAVVGPGERQTFVAQSISLVQIWTEAGAPAVDVFAEAQ